MMGAGIWRMLPLGHYVDTHFSVEKSPSISLPSSRRRRQLVVSGPVQIELHWCWSLETLCVEGGGSWQR